MVAHASFVGVLTGRSSIHVSPAAILNMQAKALSNLRNSPGAGIEKKLTPKTASKFKTRRE
jgi:hypothetical protein